MYSKVKYFNLRIFYLFCSIIAIQSCTIDIPTIGTRPNLYKIIGSQKIQLNYADTYSSYVYIPSGDQLEASCDNKFRRPFRYENATKLILYCDAGYLRFKAEYERTSEYYAISSKLLECSVLKWNLYESTANINWCPNVTSYMWTRPKNSQLDMEYSAGICYDIYKREFKSVYYTLAPKDSTNMYPKILDEYSVDWKNDNITEELSSERFLAIDDENKRLQNWLNIIDYDLHSIVHYSKKNLFSTMDHLVQFISYPTLYLNNWKYYERALEQHIENDRRTYDILAGVSGAIKGPITNGCSRDYKIKDIKEVRDGKIPQYVWNYLMDRNNRSNDLVIIGFNSQINKFYNRAKEDVIFCADKCREVPWLSRVHSAFQYKTMGSIFCCDVEEVRKSKRLEGFPEIDIRSKPQTTLEPIEVTTTLNSYEKTNDEENDDDENDLI